MPIADERPQPPWQCRRIPQPPTAIVLMLACHRDGLANRADAFEISIESLRLMGKASLRGGKRRIDSVGQNEGLAEQRASHFVQVADVDERDIAIEPERSEDWRLWILGVEPVDLVERGFDRKCSVLIDRRSPAEGLVAFENQDPVPGSGIERSGGQTAEPGADYDGVELSGHARHFSMIRCVRQ